MSKKAIQKEKLTMKNRNIKEKFNIMNLKITTRDFKFFMIGVFTMFISLLIYDWDDFEKGFKKGYNKGMQIEKTE